MDKHSKIFIAGSKGLVGSALVRRLTRGGYINLLTPEIDRLDLTDQRVGYFGDTIPIFGKLLPVP